MAVEGVAVWADIGPSRLSTANGASAEGAPLEDPAVILRRCYSDESRLSNSPRTFGGSVVSVKGSRIEAETF